MLGPPDNFRTMLISIWILIFVRTGFNTLMIHFCRSTTLIPSKHSEYLPRPAPNRHESLKIISLGVYVTKFAYYFISLQHPPHYICIFIFRFHPWHLLTWVFRAIRHYVVLAWRNSVFGGLGRIPGNTVESAGTTVSINCWRKLPRETSSEMRNDLLIKCCRTAQLGERKGACGKLTTCRELESKCGGV